MLSVVIFAQGNARALPLFLIETSRHLLRDEIPHEILIVTRPTNYSTLEAARKLQPLVPNLKILSVSVASDFGEVWREAAMVVRGDWLFALPPDGSVSVEEFHKMRPYLIGGQNLVIGARRGYRSGPLHFVRAFFKLIFNLAVNVGERLKIADATSPVFIFSLAAAREVADASKTIFLEGTAELFILARALGCQIKEVPIFATASAPVVNCLWHDTLAAIKLRWKLWRPKE